MVVDPPSSGWGWSADPELVMSRVLEEINDASAPDFDDKNAYPFYFHLADAFGWDTYRGVFATYNQDQEDNPDLLPTSNTDKKNQWLIRWSKVSGVDMVDYMVNAWGLEVDQSAIATVRAMELPTWMPMIIRDDSVDFHPGEAVTFDVLANDVIIGENREIAVFTMPAEGSLLYLGGGRFTYEPAANTTTTSFTYTTSNDHEQTPGKVTLSSEQWSEKMLLWLDASDWGSLERTDDNVTLWKDKSGQDHDAVSYHNNKQPEYTGSAVRFENDFMEIRDLDVRPSTHDALTSVAVYRYIDGNRSIWVGQENGFERRAHLSTAEDEGNLHLSTVEWVASLLTYRHWLDGEFDKASSDNYSEEGSGIGLGQWLYARHGYEGAYFSDYELSELIIYDSVLSDLEREKITEHLLQKWKG